MINQFSIPEFICNPFGIIFRVNKRGTILINEAIKYVPIFKTFASDESAKKFKNQHSSFIPNFVCDPFGLTFRVDEKITKIANYIHAIFVNFNVEKNSKVSTSSKQPEPSHEHHRNFPHRRLIKQQHHPLKHWLIAILLKKLLVVWDLWTYKSGFQCDKCESITGISQ